jgi:hypothetical protein
MLTMEGLDLTGSFVPDIAKSMCSRPVDQEDFDEQPHGCQFVVEREIGLDETECLESRNSLNPETVLPRPAPYKGFGTNCLQPVKPLVPAQ